MFADEQRELLLQASRCGVDRAGEDCRYLSLESTIALARKLKLSRRDLEIAALQAEIIPERYRVNMDTLGIAGQIKLLRSRAALIGAGGLGGYAVEMLARCGVGSLIVIDDDNFTVSNLNRQLYSIEDGLSSSKADLAVQRVRAVNGAVEAMAHRCRADADNLPRLLQGCDLVLDCLDSRLSRFVLEETCQGLNIPLVHGAVDGFRGQVAVIRPGQPLFETIYASPEIGHSCHDRQVRTGVLSFTPAAVAARQAAEAVKILACLGGSLDGVLLLIDLFTGEATRIALNPG